MIMNIGDLSENESGQSSSSSSDANRPLEQEVWFHGYLPKEDLEKLFHNDGDFGVRYTMDERSSLILNVLHRKQVKAFSIRETKKNTFFIEKKEFESVGDLIAFHTLTKFPVAEGTDVLLIRGIPTQRWELDNSMLTRREKLGGGEYGKVWKAQWKLKTNVLMVVAFKESLEKDTTAKLELLTEARTMIQMQTPVAHPNVVRCHGIAVKKDPIYLVLEYCPEGTLLKFLKSHKTSNERTRLKLCKDISLALKHLEDKKCVHRDVAARNVLLDKSFTAKLSDFGLAFIKTAPVKKDKKIPVKWTAPEALTKEEFTHKSDIWSFGVTILEIFNHGEEPWPGKPLEFVRKELQAGRSPEPPRNAPTSIQELVHQLWNQDPAKRPSAKSLKL